ncbi:MAG: DNA-processing protein DprA [Bdellovibrionota bacterium]
METAVLFKIIQRRFKFRNPNHLTVLPKNFIYTENEYKSARSYIQDLAKYNIKYSHPEKDDYPEEFFKMKEPPLFFEYYGEPIWKNTEFISVVGAREIHSITEQWLRAHLSDFVKNNKVGIVSGGAKGVDQLSHLIAIKNLAPTLFILPSGLLHLYPQSLNLIKTEHMNVNICFLSEFEIHQKLHKSHFYFRNRLIAALGGITLVAQASLKSGSLLTVHHCLEMGKAVVTIPAHPEMSGFDGNLKLLYDGAYLVRNFIDLHEFWKAEHWPY